MKAIVLLSGGVDSATCLAIAIERYGEENVSALNIYYGQKHDREIQSARSIADYYGVRYEEIDLTKALRFSDCSLLKNNNKEIEKGSYAEQISRRSGEPVSTYVPFRNGLFLSAAAAFAFSVGASVVMYGAHADDSAGNAYPDCSIEFVNSMNKAISEGTAGKVSLEAPFAKYAKNMVIKEGLRLGVPYELTWSCYQGGEKPCGVCGTCIDRIKAFEANGVTDPLMV